MQDPIDVACIVNGGPRIYLSGFSVAPSRDKAERLAPSVSYRFLVSIVTSTTCSFQANKTEYSVLPYPSLAVENMPNPSYL